MEEGGWEKIDSKTKGRREGRGEKEHLELIIFFFSPFLFTGNEPWDYSASFYVKVLEGMAKGFKDGDPNILVAPGAFQADTPDVPPQGDGISWTNKYAGLFLCLSLCLSISLSFLSVPIWGRSQVFIHF